MVQAKCRAVAVEREHSQPAFLQGTLLSQEALGLSALLWGRGSSQRRSRIVHKAASRFWGGPLA